MTVSGELRECHRVVGSAEIEQAVVNYVAKLRYKPAMLDGGPTAAPLTVVVTVGHSPAFEHEVDAVEGAVFGALAQRALAQHEQWARDVAAPDGGGDSKLCVAIGGALPAPEASFATMGATLLPVARFDECMRAADEPWKLGRYVYLDFTEAVWTNPDEAVVKAKFFDSIARDGAKYTFELKRDATKWTVRELEASYFIE